MEAGTITVKAVVDLSDVHLVAGARQLLSAAEYALALLETLDPVTKEPVHALRDAIARCNGQTRADLTS